MKVFCPNESPQEKLCQFSRLLIASNTLSYFLLSKPSIYLAYDVQDNQNSFCSLFFFTWLWNITLRHLLYLQSTCFYNFLLPLHSLLCFQLSNFRVLHCTNYTYVILVSRSPVTLKYFHGLKEYETSHAVNLLARLVFLNTIFPERVLTETTRFRRVTLNTTSIESSCTLSLLSLALYF